MPSFTLPEQMRCVEIKEPGSADKLVPAERPLPKLSAGQVLLSVQAAGVNRPDIIQRNGHYPPPPGASDILGLEVSGEVVSAADDVSSVKVGDRVCALVPGGGYAEYVAAPAATCLPIPKNLDMIEAAAIPETFFTVWHNVFERGNLKANESLLIHGGSSGIGTTAIQLAKSNGAFVVATAGSDNKCEACRKLGADLVINYKNADFVEEVRTKVSGKGVDVILDMVGGGYIPRNIRCLKPDGRLVNIAFLQGSKADVDFMPMMLKRLTITGSTLRARETGFKGAIAAALKTNVWPLLENGEVRPIIDTVLPLDKAVDAHRLMESSQHIGKIVLAVNAEKSGEKP